MKALGLLRFLQALCLNGRTSNWLPIETARFPVVRWIALLGHFVSSKYGPVDEVIILGRNPGSERRIVIRNVPAGEDVRCRFVLTKEFWSGCQQRGEAKAQNPSPEETPSPQ